MELAEEEGLALGLQAALLLELLTGGVVAPIYLDHGVNVFNQPVEIYMI